MADNKVNLLVSLKDQASAGLSGLTNKLGAFGKALNPVTLGVAALAAGLTKLAFSAAKTGDTFAKTATQIGTTSSFLSELKFAANIGGAELSDVGTALRVVSKRVNDANNGLVTSVRAFNQAGIATQKANGEFKSAEELLLDSADAFKALDSPTQRTALAMELFGRSGTRLVPILVQGSDAIKELQAEARLLGITFSDVEAKEAEDFQDALLRLKSVFIGVGNIIGKALIPTFTFLFTVLKDTLLPVISATRTAIELLGITFKIIASPIIIVVEAFEKLARFFNRITNSGRAIREFFRKLFEDDIPTDEQLERRAANLRAFFGTFEEGQEPTRFFGMALEDLKTKTDASEESLNKAKTTMQLLKQNAAAASNGIREGFGEVMQETFSSTANVMKDVGREMAETVVGGVDEIGTAFGDMIFEMDFSASSFKSIFKNMAKTLVQQVGVMIARLVALRIAMAAVGAGGGLGIGGGIFSSVIGGIGGMIGFADGGRPPVNQPSIVGERGAEIFVPDTAGTIIPNEALGGTQNIGVINIMPYANIDKALTEKPMSYWVSLTQEKILPALNNLGKSGSTTTLNFKGAR